MQVPVSALVLAGCWRLFSRRMSVACKSDNQLVHFISFESAFATNQDLVVEGEPPPRQDQNCRSSLRLRAALPSQAQAFHFQEMHFRQTTCERAAEPTNSSRRTRGMGSVRRVCAPQKKVSIICKATSGRMLVGVPQQATVSNITRCVLIRIKLIGPAQQGGRFAMRFCW